MPPALLLFLKITLAIWCLLQFYTSSRIVFFFFFYSCEKCLGILIGIALNLQLALGSMDTLTILIIPIHKHEIYFLLFVFLKISFINVLKFLVYKSSNSLLKFIPEYFILFDAIINGIVFFISHSDRLLLVYGYAPTTEFCILGLNIQNSIVQLY